MLKTRYKTGVLLTEKEPFWSKGRSHGRRGGGFFFWEGRGGLWETAFGRELFFREEREGGLFFGGEEGLLFLGRGGGGRRGLWEGGRGEGALWDFGLWPLGFLFFGWVFGFCFVLGFGLGLVFGL